METPMIRLLVLAALLLVTGSLRAQADSEEFAYCAWNSQISSSELCFSKYEDAEAYVLQDPTATKRRRFLQPVSENTHLTSGGQRATVYYRTQGVPPGPDFVTWYTASTAVGTGAGGVPIVVPDISELISELLPEEQIAGRYSEAAVQQGIHQVDGVTSGATSGAFLKGPGGAIRFDPVLDRVQVNYYWDVTDNPRIYTTAVRPWGVYKRSRAWCPAGMNIFADGLCRNSEEGLIRINTNINHASCPALGRPCIPATGAKELHETDFTWGAWQFQRHYSSLPTLALSDPQGEHWRHTFQAYLPPLTGFEDNFHHIDAFGRMEWYKRVNSTLFLAKNQTGDRIEYASADAQRRWRRVAGDGRIEYFSTSGQLTRIELSQSMKDSVDLAYCGAADFSSGNCQARDELWKVTDALGRALEFVYEPGAVVGTGVDALYQPPRIVGVRSAGQWLVQYEHDDLGRLVTANYPGGAARTYHYNEPQHACRDADGHAIASCDPATFDLYLTGITDGTGQRLSTYTYDQRGRVTSSVWAGGAYPEKIWYTSPTVRHVMYPDGTDRKLTYALSNAFLRIVETDYDGAKTTYAYDTLGKRQSIIDRRGIETRYEYSSDRVTAKIEAYGKPEQRRTESVWNDAAAQIGETKVLSASGTVQARTTRTFNARAQLETSTSIDPVTLASRTTTYAYCEAADVAAPGSTCPVLGLLKSINGPRTDVADITTFAYYAATDESGCASSGPCRRKGDLWKVTNALGHVVETLRYDGMGRVTATKDPNGVVTELTYHARGWLASRNVKGASSAEDAVTTYAYDGAGQLTRITRPDGDWTDFEYDDAHRLTAIEDTLGNRIEYALDPTGERMAETTKDPNGLVTRSLSREYDALGRLDLSHDAYAHTTDFGYDANGNQTSVEDPLGYETQQEYDALDRLKRTLQDVGGLNVETKYAYDTLDRLVKVTDPKGLDTTYTYNAFGDLMQLSSPDTGITQYTYDEAGNRKTQTDARGITATYSYDELNRVRAITYPDGSENIEYAYDRPDTVTGCAGSLSKGRLSLVIEGAAVTIYCYDRRGNVVRKAQYKYEEALVSTYAHTLGDRLAAITYPSGAKVQYQHDAIGRISTITRLVGGVVETLVSNAEYSPFGPLKEIEFGDQTILAFAYDQNYSIDTIQGVAFALDYDVDARGNVVGLIASDERSSTTSSSYAYDSLSRLIEHEIGPVSTSYSYDGTGNRLSKITTTNPPPPAVPTSTSQIYGYSPTSHRLTSVSGLPRTYDAAGNLTKREDGLVFSYNQRGRLSRAGPLASPVMSATYNARGERVEKRGALVAGGNTITFLYDEGGRLLAETQKASMAIAKEYIWMDDRIVAVRDLTGLDSTVPLFVETDHLGTPRALHNGSTIYWRWLLDGSPFGEDGTKNRLRGREILSLRFPGQYFDKETGLHYNYFRDYDPGTGRYVESDPIGLKGGLSTFAYVANNPVQYSDRLGLEMPGPWTFPPGETRNAFSRATSERKKCYCSIVLDAPWSMERFGEPTSFEMPVRPPVDRAPSYHEGQRRNFYPDMRGSVECCCEVEDCPGDPIRITRLFGQTYDEISFTVVGLIGASVTPGRKHCFDVGTPGYPVNISGPIP
jgi:RHS repeat-associated protein